METMRLDKEKLLRICESFFPKGKGPPAMVTLFIENGIWLDLTLFGPGTAACCTTFPSATSTTSRASPACCGSLPPAARCARRTFGPTAPPGSSLCYCFCRGHFIPDFRQCLIQSPDELLLNLFQSLSLTKNCRNALHHIFQSLSLGHTGLLWLSNQNANVNKKIVTI